MQVLASGWRSCPPGWRRALDRYERFQVTFPSPFPGLSLSRAESSREIRYARRRSGFLSGRADEARDGGAVNLEQARHLGGGFPAGRNGSTISLRCSAVIFGLRPGTRPWVRASRRPARVRSRIISRSNSAKEPSICIIMRPAGPEVSIDSVSERNLPPVASMRSRMTSRSLSERDSRSSFHTTSVSPARN